MLKLVVDEDGSEAAALLWDASDRISSTRLVYPEARAALAAARRNGRLEPGFEVARWKFERLYEQLHVIDIGDSLARTAGELADRHALRGYDAVHLASALELDASVTVFVSWDLDLARAGAAAGLAVAPPR